MEDETQSTTSPDAGPHYGTEFFGWEFFEYPRYSRGRLWYLAMTGVGFLLLLYAVFSANFLFALIIIMFAIVTYLTTITDPPKIRCVITESGVGVGRAFYPYKEISRFWFIYEPPTVKNMYLEFKNPLRPRISVDLDNQNPNDIRSGVGQFVHEDISEEDVPFSDYIGRILKI